MLNTNQLNQIKKILTAKVTNHGKSLFDTGLQRIADSLTKKGGVKQTDKVYERIGKLKQKYPSIHRHFDIVVQTSQQTELPSKTKKSTSPNEPQSIVTSLQWSVKENVEINERSGIYFLRTSQKAETEEQVWQFYNLIREIEATFRVLKTDLDLRPIYHQKDESTMAHLHLGLLAYWLVNTVRYQLKKERINIGWREIVRTMNSQKAVTTLAQNVHEQVIMIRRCSEPNQPVKQLYDALKYKYAPFIKRKSVVHKSELKNCQNIEKQEILSG